MLNQGLGKVSAEFRRGDRVHGKPQSDRWCVYDTNKSQMGGEARRAQSWPVFCVWKMAGWARAGVAHPRRPRTRRPSLKSPSRQAALGKCFPRCLLEPLTANFLNRPE